MTTQKEITNGILIPEKKRRDDMLKKTIKRIRYLKELKFSNKEISHILGIQIQVVSSLQTKGMKYLISLNKLLEINERYEVIFPNE